MRLSFRPVRSTIDVNQQPTKVPNDDIAAEKKESAIVWEDSGFAVETSKPKRNFTAHSEAVKRKIRKTMGLQVDTSSDESSCRLAKLIYSEGSSDSLDDDVEDYEWLDQVYTESTIEVRKEMSEIVLHCLMGSAEGSDSDKDAPSRDRYCAASQPESSHHSNEEADWHAPMSKTVVSTTAVHPISPLVSTTSKTDASVTVSLEVAHAMEEERRRIRAEIVKSMSIGTTTDDDDDAWPGHVPIHDDDFGPTTVESFLLMIGFRCLVPHVPLTPEHPKGNVTVSWVDSISLSSLSY